MPLNQQKLFINAPVYVDCSMLKHIMISASESEIAGAYVNAREGI